MKDRSYLRLAFWFSCLAAIIQAQSSTSPFQLRIINADAQKHLTSNGTMESPVQLYYYLRGKFPHFGNSGYEGSWRGQFYAEIPTKVYDTAAQSFAALVYERGCAVQYITVEDLEHATRSLDMPCVPQQSVRLRTTISNLEEAGGGEWVAEVNYQAIRPHWIEEDQVQMNTRVNFYVGSFPVGEDKALLLELPDFGNDPTVNRHLKQGRYQIWIHPAHHAYPGYYAVMPHNASEAPRFLPVSSRYPESLVLQLTTGNEFAWE